MPSRRCEQSAFRVSDDVIETGQGISDWRAFIQTVIRTERAVERRDRVLFAVAIDDAADIPQEMIEKSHGRLSVQPAFYAPIGVVSGPAFVHAIKLDPPDAIVFKPTQVEITLVLAHRGQRRMRNAGGVPPGFQRLSIFIELEYAAMIESWRQPLVGRDLLDHAEPKAGLARGKVESRCTNANQRQPVIAVRGAVDVIGVARQFVDQNLGPPLVRTLKPIAEDLAERGACDQKRLAVMRDADPVREIEMVDNGAGGPGRGIVADHAAVRARLQDVERVGRHFVPRRAVAEINLAVRPDVEVVSHAQAGIVVELVPGTVGFVGYLEHLAVRLDAVHAHAGNGDDQVLVSIELHSERPAADMRKDLAGFEVGTREADDVAVTGRTVEAVLAIQNTILRSLNLIEADRLGVNEARVLSVGRGRVRLDRRRRRKCDKRRIDVDFLDRLAAVLRPLDVY